MKHTKNLDLKTHTVGEHDNMKDTNTHTLCLYWNLYPQNVNNW
jgi:hypothetical protein